MRVASMGWILALIGLTGGAEAQSFTKVADTNTQSGDGSTLYTYDTPSLSGGTVAFIARSLNGLVALYAAPSSGGPLVKLVDINTKVPGGTGTFTVGRVNYFTAFSPAGCSPPVVGTSSVAFVGLDAAGNEGLYSVALSNGKLKLLANYKTAVPGMRPNGPTMFNSQYSFCHLAISGTTVVFDAGSNSGVYSIKTNGAGLSRIADAGTSSAAPPPFTTVNGYGLPSLLRGTAAYIGSTTGGPYGIYAGGTTGLGSVVVATGSSEANGFDQFAYPVLGGKTVLFSASLNGDAQNDALGLIDVSGSPAAKLIFSVSGSKVPAGALGDVFAELGTDATNFSGNDGARQVFSAETSDQSPKPYAAYDGVYSFCKKKLTKIVETGDAIGSQQVNAVGGISLLQQMKTGQSVVDQFAALLTARAPSTPSIDNGAPGIYVVSVPGC